MTDIYLNTKDLADRYRVSSRTIFRRMNKPDNPFPAPAIKMAGSSNLWLKKDVELWDARQRELTSIDRFLNEQEEISRSREKPEDNNFH